MSNDWPTPSSPVMLPRVNLYFARVIGDARQDIYVHNFVTDYQCGVFIRHIMRDAELLSQVEVDDDITEFEYLVTIEKDAQGEPVQRRHFWARLVGASYDRCMKKSQGHSLDQMPFSEHHWLKMARGTIRTTRDPDVIVDHVVSSDGRSREVVRGTMRNDEPPAPIARRKERVPRHVRNAMVTVESLCREANVAASDVRGLLRKRKVPKPDAGWAYAEGDPGLTTVMDVIAAVKRGEKK